MQSLILNKNLTFDFNPFGGLSDAEIQKVLVPKPFTNNIFKDINNKNIDIIELVGAKGRGKTSLLRYLNSGTKNATLVSLETKKDKKLLSNINHDILFLDSIHNISFFDRLSLFKSGKKIILTTHISRLLEYKLANSNYKKYKIEGIQAHVLESILKNRIANTSNINPEKIILNNHYIVSLIKKYKDDYRAILNFLFDNFNS